MLAVRLRLGAVLSNGRVAGHVDQPVHLVPIPEGPVVSSPLRAYCGLMIEPRTAEVVDAVSGAPCVKCLLAAPASQWSPEGLVY